MPKPTLAKPYTDQPVSGWLMSEKLDGVRAVWTGSRFISRNGNEFVAPDDVLQQMPAGIMLDGELYAGRGSFQQCAAVVRTKRDADWSGLGFQVFDAPQAPGDFIQRLQFAADVISALPTVFVGLVQHHCCQSLDHAQAFARKVTRAGGEGIMLRDPRMAYVAGRTSQLLKIKPVDHAEAVVIGHKPGRGHLQGLVGSLVCRTGDRVFCVGSGLNEDQRRSAPVIGATITYSHKGLTAAGIPRHPSFVAVRDYE